VARDQVTKAEETVTNAELAVEGARVKIDQNRLLLDKARTELAGTIVTAPFSGVVLKSSASAGDVVNAGNVLLTLADVSRVRLNAEVDEYDIGQITVGLPVTVTSDALPDADLKSKVERVSPAAEIINNISIFTVSTVLRNDDGSLRPGMSADISILVSSDSGIIVPSKTVSTVRDRSYVKVYENGEVVTKRVTAGSSDGVNTAVLEGLAEGDLVVLPESASLNLTTTTTSSGTSIVPITVPGTGGSR
jgi:HlyD family secretion protein